MCWRERLAPGTVAGSQESSQTAEAPAWGGQEGGGLPVVQENFSTNLNLISPWPWALWRTAGL